MSDDEKRDALGPEGRKFFAFATQKMRGQDKAIYKLAKALDAYAAGLADPTRPIYSVLVVGGSGSGKSMLPELLAEYWFGSPDALTCIVPGRWSNDDVDRNQLAQYDYNYRTTDGSGANAVLCDRRKLQEQEYALDNQLKQEILSEREHKVATKKLAAVRKRLAQLNPQAAPLINALRSIVVFDFFERNEDVPYHVLSAMLDEGLLPDGDDATLRHAVIFILCHNEARSSGAKGKIGFDAAGSSQGAAPKKKGNMVYLDGVAEIKDCLPPALLSRIDRIEILRKYDPSVLKMILEDMIRDFQGELASTFPVFLSVDPAVADFIVSEASDHSEWGIRLLQRKFNKYVRQQLAIGRTRGDIKEGNSVQFTLASRAEKKAVVMKVENVSAP
ncbi:MAG: ATP-dependent Clp protease ATP-binding subunit [Patescibacteria group bacterium]|nr:ATP-dependent Clp protease ATP-binding subunit [Patescibacteria group bacterium]